MTATRFTPQEPTPVGRWARCAVALALVLGMAMSLLAPSPASAAPQATPAISVMAFNVLAPPWADPQYYPAGAAPLLDRALRRQHVIEVLQAATATTDVFALQETTAVEFGYLKAALPAYTGFQAFHAPSYWANWITPANPWEPNGVAVFVRTSKFKGMTFADVPLTADGNHAAVFTGISTVTGRPVRVISVHLDSDSAGNRNKEFNAALAHLPRKQGTIDLIAGDFNTDTDTGNFHTDMANAGFVDVLRALGVSDYTSPWSDTYYKRGQWGVMDHVIARGAAPRAGGVMTFGLFTRYPTDQDARIIENLRISGSDHFPVVATVAP